MRNLILLVTPTLLVLGGCMTAQSSDPDTVGIGPIPDPVVPATAGGVILQANRDDLACLRDELEVALAQAPTSGSIEFHGVRLCGIVSQR